jgi:hypothetical protein
MKFLSDLRYSIAAFFALVRNFFTSALGTSRRQSVAPPIFGV